MPDGGSVVRQSRVDAAGRPVEGRGRQALTAFSIIISWVCLTVLIFWATRGAGPEMPAPFFAAIAVVAWLSAEAFGGKHAQVWPASALAIAGSLSLGFAVGLATSHARGPDIVSAVALISGVSALSMVTFLFRFRLPGLVSPIITFAIISLFLTSYGLNSDSLARVEGLSPRGILAALISSPLWMAIFGFLGGGALVLARWLDLNGEEFGIASARPLHIVGAGVSALIVGRMLGQLPLPLDVLGLIALWVAGTIWALRINRIAVGMAIHLAIAKPLVLGMADLLNPGSAGAWLPDMNDWMLIFVAITVFDLVIWYRLHQISLARGWTLGPGGRIPRPRDGWMWRYWPYA